MELEEGMASSGIAGLDEVLYGGYARGLTYLIEGESGAGKTTLSMQFLLDGARRGERVLYLGTSETEAEIGRIAESHGWSLDGITIYHQTPVELGEDQTVVHPAEVELPQTIKSMLAVVDEIEPDRVVIDSLAEIRVLARDELWYRRQLLTLKHHLAQKTCTVLLVEIPAVSSVLNSIVTGVIELEQLPSVYGPDRRRLRALKVRGHRFMTGYHDYKICTGGLEVFPHLTAAAYRRQFTPEVTSTGLPAMDAMLHGGLVRGTSTLLLGPSGTAKSLLATHLAASAAERGERAAMYVFDERVQTLYQRANGVGLPLQEHVDAGLIEVRQIDPAELTAGEFSQLLKTAVEVDGLKLLVIDSLNGYAYAMPEEHVLSVHLHELTSYLNQQNVTSIFTMTQHGLLSERSEQPFDVSYISDTVVLLRHFEFMGEVHKAMSIYKHRTGSHETSVRELRIGSKGLQFGETLRQFQGILSGSPVFLGESLQGSRNDEFSGR